MAVNPIISQLLANVFFFQLLCLQKLVFPSFSSNEKLPTLESRVRLNYDSSNKTYFNFAFAWKWSLTFKQNDKTDVLVLLNFDFDQQLASLVYTKFWLNSLSRFSDKTKNDWAHRKSFEKVAGKYDLVEIDYGKNEPAKTEDAVDGLTKSASIPVSKLDNRLQVSEGL